MVLASDPVIAAVSVVYHSRVSYRRLTWFCAVKLFFRHRLSSDTDKSVISPINRATPDLMNAINEKEKREKSGADRRSNRRPHPLPVRSTSRLYRHILERAAESNRIISFGRLKLAIIHSPHPGTPSDFHSALNIELFIQ